MQNVLLCYALVPTLQILQQNNIFFCPAVYFLHNSFIQQFSHHLRIL